MGKIMGALWRNFLAGIFVILPAVLTIWIVQILFQWVYHLFVAPFARLITPWVTAGWAMHVARAALVVGFVLAVAAIGWGTKILLFRRFFNLGEKMLQHLPFVGKIYGTIREISNAFGGGRRGAFSRVVLLEWPRKGLYALGFVTAEGKGEVQEKTPEEVVNVFVPTTPNPTSGYLILADRNAIIPLSMSVEEGMKLVISGGTVGPVVKPSQGPHS
jgi:uncharacterized membrane protein